MPRKATLTNEEPDNESDVLSEAPPKNEDEIANLTRMLGAVLNYLSDDDLEEIDIEFLLDDTEGLREWWESYQENNRKHLEEEIKKSLGELSMKELKKIREKIKETKD